MVVAGRDFLAPDRIEARRPRLLFELRRRERPERDLVEVLAELPVGGDGLPQPADDDQLTVERRSRAAGSSRPSRRPRGRREAAAGPRRSPGRGPRRSRTAARPPGVRWRATQPRHRSAPPGRRAAARSASAPGPGRTARSRSNSRASAATASAGRPAARSLKAATKSGVAIDSDDPVPASGQVQGDPAGAAAEVEDRALGGLGVPLPGREVGLVGAALEVMPKTDSARLLCSRSFRHQ